MKAERLGVFSALLVSSCCTIPVALVLLGIGGAGFGTFFNEYHWWFQAGAAVLITAAWWFFLRERRRLYGLGSEVKNERFTRWTLALASAIVTAFLGMSGWTAAQATFAATPTTARAQVTESNLRTITLPVKGMTCFTCELHVTRTLKKLEGVKGAEASVARASATVRYDPARASVEQLVEAINKETPYEAVSPEPNARRRDSNAF